MYEYDRRTKTAAWDDEIEDAAKNAKDAVEDALKASEQAKKAINALVHLASKNNVSRTPLFSPITVLDIILHKAGSPSDLYGKAVKDLGEVVKRIKGS